VAANEPLINPAIAAPAIIVFFVMLTFLFWFLLVLAPTLSRRKSIKLGNAWITNFFVRQRYCVASRRPLGSARLARSE
jgi:hypothetical protein